MHDDDDHSDGFDLGSVEEGSTEEIEGLERFTLTQRRHRHRLLHDARDLLPLGA